jgi:uncharacterized protein
MKLRVDTIPEEGMDIEGDIGPEQIGLDMPNYRLTEPLHFSGHATKTEEDVYIEGMLRGEVDADCSRCLEPMKLPLELELNVMFVPKQKLPEGDNGSIEPESNLAFYVDETIDLLQELRDLLLVNLPIKPICRPDCKGLCALCGKDLNISGCDCPESPTESPFSKLLEVKKRMEKK